MSRLGLAAALIAVAACDDRQAVHELEPSWERMMEQPKVEPFTGAMRRPPHGTVTFGAAVRGEVVETGSDGVLESATIPVPIGDAELRHGRQAFQTYCAACHGILGDGESAVAPHMTLRRPPSLHEDRIRAYAPGRIFGVVSEGYGLMPSYAAELSVDERWDVVAYVEVLQLSQRVAVADLAPDDVQRLDKEGASR